MLVRQVADPKLAQFAYLIGCPRSGEAIVIDPERDVDRYFDLAARHKLRIVAAADTHIHADYLSGLREMAARGVFVYASKEGGPDWQYEWLIGTATTRTGCCGMGISSRWGPSSSGQFIRRDIRRSTSAISFVTRAAAPRTSSRWPAATSCSSVTLAGPTSGASGRYGRRHGTVSAGAVRVDPTRVPGLAGVPPDLAGTRRRQCLWQIAGGRADLDRRLRTSHEPLHSGGGQRTNVRRLHSCGSTRTAAVFRADEA